MNIQEIIKIVLNSSYLVNDPPVLLDLGASGELHKDWELIAPYSICLAFDADDRDFSEKITNSVFKKLHLINKIVSNQTAESIPFFLTSSPYCSSTLKPDKFTLEDWKFWKLFEIEKQISLPNITLNQILGELAISKIDWFKTDTQGTDLRLFKSLPDDIQKRIIIAEFEPGIIDAYQGEDKLHHVLAYMDTMPFWAMSLDVKGAQRISKRTMNKYNLNQNQWLNMPECSCWGEISYFNSFKLERSNRDILLGWLLATLKNQNGFALDLLNNTNNTIKEELMQILLEFSQKEILDTQKSPFTIKQRVKNKLIYYISKF